MLIKYRFPANGRPAKALKSAYLVLPSVMLLATLVASGPAFAADAKDKSLAEKLDALTQIVKQQQAQMSDMQAKLSDREERIDELERRVGKMKSGKHVETKKSEAAASPAPSRSKRRGAQDSDIAPEQVGEAPPSSDKPPEIPILANTGGVLTPYGTIVAEPFAEYSRSSVNTFSFAGVELLPAFQIGAISANRTARDLVTAGAAVRAGVTDRLELEAKVPFVYRSDSFTNAVTNVSNVAQTNTSEGAGIGDVEVAAHYQINNGQNDWPFFIGNLRLKTNTGTNPYEVAYKPDGTAKELATGSGFISIAPSVTVIQPMDPAVLFANVGYIYTMDRDINRVVAGNAIGRVSPGDTYMASVGMGVSLNDKLSFTLGYEHDYVRPTETIIGGSAQRSDALQVGSALTGFSLKVNDRVRVNLNVAAGVTRDAPDAQVSVRVPVSFQAF